MMTSWKMLFILLAGFVIGSGCTTSPSPNCDFQTACGTMGEAAADLPRDVYWIRQSVEYQALCTQVYRLAWQSVKQQAAGLDRDWTVVLDVDETALDNSCYEKKIYMDQRKFPDCWDEWVLAQQCPPVPGVKAFIDSVRTLGLRAHVAYITNRNAPLAEATRANLKAAGLWQEGDVLLCQQSREDTKEIRRSELRSGTGRCAGLGEKQIIALIGDQIGDMEAYPDRDESSGHPSWNDQLRSHYLELDKWGTHYFILPNPMYGYWERGYQR